MKWLAAEAPAVIVSIKTPFFILLRIRFKETFPNGYKNDQTQPLVASLDDLMVL
jgi:hypothetical protein